jgi:hypothetical protein
MPTSSPSRPSWRLTSLLGAALLLGGCTSLPDLNTLGQVKPWEKSHLAQPGMSLDMDALDQKFIQHVYASKENSSGGNGVGGGGCGCN